MLEKLACALLAGVPCIVKPATVTSYLTEAVFRAMVETGVLPAGAIQLVCGSAGDLLDHLTAQDAVAFTGSADTGQILKKTPAMMEHNVRFNQEADSLNFSMLGPDARPGTEEFDLFVKEVAREMTVKAGQKCTAIRRTFVPDAMVDDVVKALASGSPARASATRRSRGCAWGRSRAVAGARGGARARRAPGRDGARLRRRRLRGGGREPRGGAFFPITLLYNDRPFDRTTAHDVEAFGPVNTLMPYGSVDEAVELAKRGRGSLCGSLFTADDRRRADVALGTAAYHGRLLLANRHSAKESTGHGSPLPHLVHGGPGRAGGGEEMGGVRGVLHYMQRTALQGSPATVAAVTHEWSKGAAERRDRVHPFRKHFEELEVGETWVTHRRTVTEADVTNFAGVSGDFFYAHVDEIAARESIFERRVAHGYFVISAAAGLFVDPAPGPVLANYGLEGLRFVKPVYVGDTIQVRLACKSKAAKDDREDQVPQGVVSWDVEVVNQDGEAVAVYTVLTLVKRLHPVGYGRRNGANGADAAAGGADDGAVPHVLVTEQPGTAPARMS
jgi:oxepin-CoA hydrolase/3-oxo-5,6-dehydrosuberyl-CoA semialdehyde dehydrogenase